MFPTRIDAIVHAVLRAFDLTKDKFVRLDCAPTLDLAELIGRVSGPQPSIRFGVLAPFDLGRTRRAGTTANAREITRWRNEAVANRAQRPVLVVGRAGGPEEAGLKSAPIVVRETDVFVSLQVLGTLWLAEHVPDTTAPSRFFVSLIRMGKEGLLDCDELSEYFRVSFADPQEAHLKPQRELWRLGLLPDERAQDSATPGARLSLNLSIAEILRSAADTKADEQRLERLRAHAAEGDPTAGAAVRYISTRKRQELAATDLDKILELLGTHNPRQVRVVTVDMWDLLDSGDAKAEEALGALGSLWLLEDDSVDATVAYGTMQARFATEALTDCATIESLFCTHTADSSVPQPTLDTQLLSVAADVQALIGTTELLPLVQQYVDGRRELYPLARWSEHLLELLILKPTWLARCDGYLRSWEAVGTWILRNQEVAHTVALRDLFALVDADWEVSADSQVVAKLQSAELMPIHPLTLAPVVAIARNVAARVGQPDRGSQAQWALDRAVPAYPAIWARGNTLLHSGGTDRPRFDRHASSQRPVVNRGNGLDEIAESYLGFHPYAKSHLTLLLIDPPTGRGIASALRRIKSQADQLTVHTVFSTGHSPVLDVPSVRIRHHGKRQDLIGWSQKSGLSVHIACLFMETKPAQGGVAMGPSGPSRGIHNALTVSLVTPDALLSASNSQLRIPCVSLQPRDANQTVSLLMELGRASEREDRFFVVQPMVDDAAVHHIAALSDLADWLVVGAPSPLGLIPPRQFPGGSLTYLGREDFGTYALYAYARDLFVVRRRVQSELREVPLQPNVGALESQLERLALMAPNGILRMGRGQGTVTPQLGVMVAAHIAEVHPHAP